MCRAFLKFQNMKRKKYAGHYSDGGFLTIVCGLIVMLSQIYASFLFYQNGIYGLGLTCTSGMVGVTAILIANGIYSIIHAKKLYKNNSITNTTAQHATDT